MKKSKKIILEILSYLGIILLVIFIKSYVISPIKVNGSSMYKTLLDKDIMILNEFTYYFNDIKRFDIVVVEEGNELLIKRVIGLPGEVIDCIDGDVYINNKKLDEDYVNSITSDFERVKIGKNEYFVMGDNRVVSLDSRFYGTYNKSEIKGKASFTVYPFSRFGIKK